MIGLKSNKIGDVYQWFKTSLQLIIDQKERKAIADEVFLRFFNSKPDMRIAYPDTRITESDIVRLKKAFLRLNRGEPVQYVTGVAEFLGKTINVKPGVLIPRPETEELVLWVSEHLKTKMPGLSHPKVYDIGTGSGCIIIALASMHPEGTFFASDKDKYIVEVAEHNALYNKVNILFFIDDIFSCEGTFFRENDLDVVVSNPPYVRESEKQLMARNVLDHEPAAALFVPDSDPLRYYRAIASKAFGWLCPGGGLFFEINEAMGEACAELLHNLGFTDITIKKDIHGKDRFIKGSKPLALL